MMNRHSLLPALRRLLPLSSVATAVILLFTGCGEGHREPTEADRSSFGTYVYALDTVRLELSLSMLVEGDTSHLLADQAVRHYYGAHPHLDDVSAPLWFSRMGVASDADSLLAVLRRELPRFGLDSTHFLVPEIATDLAVVHALAFDSLGIDINDLLPRLDYNLSRAYVRYCTGQRYGFMRPERVFNHLDPKGNDYARLFDYDVKAPDYAASLNALTSPDRLGYLAASLPSNPMWHDLVHQLDSTSDAVHRRTLAVNIERCRWQMATPAADDSRRIVVNIPSQQLWAIAPDTVLNMRICCGTTLTKTPLLHSAVNVIHVNPDWIIPQSIVRGEIARHGGDSAYFARHRYYIVNRATGDTLRASGVSVSQLESGRLRVGQQGGPGNSLGRIVFRFPNDFAVYLHDTNNRSAFQRERRTLSHGCIRVEKPFDLALFVLPELDEWTADRLRISMDLKPETDRGRDYLAEHASERRPHRLINAQKVEPRVPVYLIYYTAYPNPITKEVELWPDLYGYDRVIANELTDVLTQ